MNASDQDQLKVIRTDIVGSDAQLQTPFGVRPLVYADYTASGRCLTSVEDELRETARLYANSHTEDDHTGQHMTHLLHEAEDTIKVCVNAGPKDSIIACGTGATGAIERLQQILGIAIPPASRDALFGMVRATCSKRAWRKLTRRIEASRPVVFVGPYEHHSNEISWREGLCTVVAIDLAADGSIDLNHLDRELQRPEYRKRRLIGAFSAASNVTGMVTEVHKIAALLHRNGAIACFDFAAAGPYMKIDMNPDEGAYDGDASLDAIVLSPHKFLGGPGSCGILLFKNHLYRTDLPPTMSAGGTVSYVGPSDQEYYSDIEAREKPGTPGIFQLIRAAKVMVLKRQITVEQIETRESELLQRAFSIWMDNGQIDILGNVDPARRIGIVSFNIKDPRGGVLHPKLVTNLLNDLFGIQSRAGCSCAGPYGHRLLNIDEETSRRYHSYIRTGKEGLKPGWCRVSLHYAMSDDEVDYIIRAIDFLGTCGYRFVHLYEFCPETGAWTFRKKGNIQENVCANDQAGVSDFSFEDCLATALSLAAGQVGQTPGTSSLFDGEAEALRFFSVFN